jgi:pimeloyl-ACP methyl ester carboxylesterase
MFRRLLSAHQGAAVLAAIVSTCCCPARAAPPEAANPPPALASAIHSVLALPARGSLLAGPTLFRIEMGPFSSAKHIEPEVLAGVLDKAGEALAAAAGKPRCTITSYSLRYRTIGGGGEATDAGAALILPSGSDPACSGPRPLLLYAHGTSIAKDHNMARLRGEARLVAALFTAQGYIVVAPNYAGYEGSSLPYHPYLNAEQQAADMIDALRAARAAMQKMNVTPGPQLFLAGYSQGGFVTLATQRAMQQYPQEFQVTAAAGLSGPYALAQFSDAVFGGQPNAGITVYLPLIATSAQRAGAAIYGAPDELYESPYASEIETLLPGTLTRSDLFKRNKLPARAMFALDSQPQAVGAGAYFGDVHLIRSSYRAAYLQDMASNPCTGELDGECGSVNQLRKWMRKNDLRNYRPASPVLLCGGSQDPSVPFFNATATAAYFTAHGAPPTVVDLEQQDAQDGFGAARRTFVLMREHVLKTAPEEAAKSKRTVADIVADNYHARLAGAPCLLAARQFFGAAMH